MSYCCGMYVFGMEIEIYFTEGEESLLMSLWQENGPSPFGSSLRTINILLKFVDSSFIT